MNINRLALNRGQEVGVCNTEKFIFLPINQVALIWCRSRLKAVFLVPLIEM